LALADSLDFEGHPVPVVVVDPEVVHRRIGVPHYHHDLP